MALGPGFKRWEGHRVKVGGKREPQDILEQRRVSGSKVLYWSRLFSACDFKSTQIDFDRKRRGNLLPRVPEKSRDSFGLRYRI